MSSVWPKIFSIYAFCQTHSTPFKRHSQLSRSSSRPSPKSCRYWNPTISGQCRRNSATKSGHLRRNPVSPDSGDQIGYIPAKWPESGRPDLARKSWPERPDSNGSGIFRPICRSPAILCHHWTKIFVFHHWGWWLNGLWKFSKWLGIHQGMGWNSAMGISMFD